ncbi:MAG: pantoate--beta-alanine ligase [Clostridia bacterium]|nr:pantoate--beta-alanine ligase [Clostridia bacterium]
MQIIKTVAAMNGYIREAIQSGKCIGYVPTMGYLHDGHLSLIKEARKNNDIVVVSIFVNPTQFGPNEDLDSYPRDLDRDAALCEVEGADVIFHPTPEEMYPNGYSTYVETFGEITKKLCGASREGHFRGVTTVLTKLFNIVRPRNAYFGQKDAQQVAVVEKMVRELNYDIHIVPCPIVREKDGLAMSSRNSYLQGHEREDALVLSQSLELAKQMIADGERSTAVIKQAMCDKINSVESTEIDYVEIVDAQELENVETLSGDTLIALAVKVGKPRLIDNVRLEVK